MNQVKRSLAKSGFSCRSLDANYMDYIEAYSERTSGFKTPEEVKRLDREKRIKRELLKQNKKAKVKKGIKQINKEAREKSYIKSKPVIIKAFNYVS